MLTQIETRRLQSLNRVGVRLKKTAEWFLRFVESDPASFTQAEYQECWDDLITMCQLADKEGRRPRARKGQPEPMVTIKMSPSSRLRYENKEYESGSVIDLPQSLARGVVRGGSATYASPPPIVRHDHVTVQEELNAWEHATSMLNGESRNPCYDGSLEREQCFGEIHDIHRKLKTAIEGYLNGEEPIIALKDVCFRLGPSQLLPATPFSAINPTQERYIYSGAEAPVMVRFARIFFSLGDLFRRCPCCQELFLAKKRKDQRACSDKCRAKFGMKRLREDRRRRASKNKRMRAVTGRRPTKKGAKI